MAVLTTIMGGEKQRTDKTIRSVNKKWLDNFPFNYYFFLAKGEIAANLDFVIVATGDEKGLLGMEPNSTDGTLMLVKLLQKGAHSVVPQLDHAIVQTEKKFS